jgi:hypothetical protein
MRKRFATLCATTTIAAASLFAPTAGASPPFTQGSGTYAVVGVTVHDVRQVGNYTLIRQTLTIDNEGVLDGLSDADVVCAFEPSGEGACAGVERFAGTIGGRTGTATFTVGLTVDAAGFHGVFHALDGDGGLEGLVGSGTFEGGPTGVNAFTFRFR